VTETPPPPTDSKPPKGKAKPKDDEMSTVPFEVIDVMLRNNIDVKKCFYQYYQAHGSLPSRVDVEFTLLTSGRVENTFLASLDYAGSDLETCLSGALKKIDFPPSGKSQKLTYPFVLQ
ncbi:MAG: AgmX/PglI C-terminal domain-containing protein, partial [Proteobacteria bacterium]|nr:AgmX/PglI C-terminal domain-containing protein [Pseudomonadota bacterium]